MSFKRTFKCVLTWLLLSQAMKVTAATGECIVPSKPGGGFDLTCKLIQKGLQAGSLGAKDTPMRISYLPGGIGAVAWSSITTQHQAEADTLVAFSSGSLINIALGKFGRASPSDVRWVAGVGADYGMIAVRDDSPYKTLKNLADALKRDPSKITIGAGGTIGSQDWLKMALLMKQAGGNPKNLHLVAFERGGESFTALMAGHVQAVSGDASEASLYVGGGKVRVLAVLSDARLAGALANVPTAREQGFDMSWPLIRGVYMGPKVSDADYRRWVAAFDKAMATQAFSDLRAALGLYPFAMTGEALNEFIKKAVDNYSRQVKELGLVR